MRTKLRFADCKKENIEYYFILNPPPTIAKNADIDRLVEIGAMQSLSLAGWGRGLKNRIKFQILEESHDTRRSSEYH